MTTQPDKHAALLARQAGTEGTLLPMLIVGLVSVTLGGLIIMLFV